MQNETQWPSNDDEVLDIFGLKTKTYMEIPKEMQIIGLKLVEFTKSPCKEKLSLELLDLLLNEFCIYKYYDWTAYYNNEHIEHLFLEGTKKEDLISKCEKYKRSIQVIQILISTLKIRKEIPSSPFLTYLTINIIYSVLCTKIDEVYFEDKNKLDRTLNQLYKVISLYSSKFFTGRREG